MAKNLQVGNDVYSYPENNENPGWGEDATAWAEAVSDALATVQGPNDIPLTTSTLSNNQTTFADIPSFELNAANVQAFSAEYLVIREYDPGSGAITVTESGTIRGNYDGSDFYISVDNERDAGITFEITSAGKLQYKTTDLTGHVSSTIKFKAKTIDQ